MSRGPRYLALLALGLAAVLGLGRLAGELPARGLELGATNRLEPDPELVELLLSLEQPLHATWFVTAEERQPSERRGFGPRVAELLARLAAAAPGRFDFTVADPADTEGNPDLARYAARRGVAPFHATGVRGDSASSRSVHATLLLERGLARPARLEHLGPGHLGVLQRLLLERLQESRSPSAPRLLLVRPEARAGQLDTLAELLDQAGELRTSADDRWAEDPDLALWPDLVLWVAPGPDAPPAQVARFLESGRALVVAEPAGAPALLADLGVVVEAPAPGPRLETSIAPDQDFRLLAGQPDGTLAFSDPVGLGFDGAALDRRGASGRHLATSPETEDAPKRGLVALVDPADPREGRLVVLAAATPLTDAGLAPPGSPDGLPLQAHAHRRLVELLLDSFTSADRRVLLRALPEPPGLATELGPGTRWLVRASLWLPLPLVLLAIVVLRGGRPRLTAAGLGGSSLAPRLTLGLVVLLGVAWLVADVRWPRLDATRGGLASPSPLLTPIAADLADEVPGGELHVALVLSRAGRLPVGLRDLERRTRELLTACADAGLGLVVERLEPERLDQDGRRVLEARGIEPFHHDLDGARTRAWATLLLTAGSTELRLDFADDAEGSELEFRLALALERLRLGRDPVLGLATDLPRMSAAEDYEFQSRGSFAPREGDVFGRARFRLARAGFDVRHVSPREPDVADADLSDLDALVWLQPRREARPMLDALAGHLVRGGRALVAAQHFRTQVRQYRGADFEPVFWPQPQQIDLERFWLPDLGVELRRRLVLDRLDAELPLTERVTAGATETSFATRTMRRPFLVRVPTTQFADDPRLDGVGDLALADPSAIRVDGELLSAAELAARPLLFGSPDAWTVDWQGGWLTDEMLAGPGPDADPDAEEQPDVPRPAPRPLLGLELRGSFPPPVGTWEDYAPHAAELTPDGSEGRLVLLGSSAFLTDPMLLGPARGDGLLLNLVADLALEEFGPHGAALAELARRRPTVPGFAPPSPGERGLARALVIGGGPLVVVLLALALRGRRSRTGPEPTSAGTAPASRAPRPTRRTGPATLAAPAVVALAAWAAALGTDALVEDMPRGELRIGRPLPEATRARTLAALRVSRAPRPGAEPLTWTYLYQGGGWRETEGLGALGDGPAIGALVDALFEAEGRVVHPGTGDLDGWKLEPHEAWRFELFEPLPTDAPAGSMAEVLASLPEPFATVEVGLQTREGTEAWLRAGDDPALWLVDRSPRPLVDPTWQPGRTRQDLPPLMDRDLVASSWPGRGLAIDVVAWQLRGGKSQRLVRTAVERTPEELRGGAPPLAWRLVGAEGPFLLDGGAAGDGAEAFLELVMAAETTELLDPARAADYGLGPGTMPEAILFVQAAPSEEWPEGLGLSLEIGPALPAELGGGRAVVSGFAGNLLRLPEELFEALTPPGEAFGDSSWQQRWQLLRQRR